MEVLLLTHILSIGINSNTQRAMHCVQPYSFSVLKKILLLKKCKNWTSIFPSGVDFPFLPQCLLTSRHARCRARCLSAPASICSVRTSSACLRPPTAGTKTTRLWQPQETLRTASTQTREHWWAHPNIVSICAVYRVTVAPLVFWLYLWWLGAEVQERVQRRHRDVSLRVLQQCGGAKELCSQAAHSCWM